MKVEAVRTKSDEELIAEYIERDPYHPGAMDAIVRERHIHVWALVGELKGNDWNVQDTADGYRISTEAVRAALAYYKAHKEWIEARLEANEG